MMVWPDPRFEILPFAWQTDSMPVRGSIIDYGDLAFGRWIRACRI